MDSRYTTTTSTTRQASTMSSTHQSPVAKIAPPQSPVRTSSSSTDPFLKDFTLVAEAAKRAQMAVLMRDFEGIGL